MFDLVLDVGRYFDWFSPLLAFYNDLTHGPHHTFMIRQNCGWSGNQIVSLLHRYGIRTWGHMIVNRTILFTVRLSQAAFAEYLLLRAGLPLESEAFHRKGYRQR